MAKSKGSKFYAVAIGRAPGIYRTWDECQQQVCLFFKYIFHTSSYVYLVVLSLYYINHTSIIYNHSRLRGLVELSSNVLTRVMRPKNICEYTRHHHLVLVLMEKQIYHHRTPPPDNHIHNRCICQK